MPQCRGIEGRDVAVGGGWRNTLIEAVGERREWFLFFMVSEVSVHRGLFSLLL